jgi:peroxiredoxin
VWNQKGSLDGKALTAALDKHVVPAPGARTAPLRLTIQPGDPMPDLVFTDDEGNQISARRLRGQNVLLAFWKSWSAPCIQELRRLQRLQHQPHPPFVLAINGGEDRYMLADMRGHHKFTFPLIHDPLQAIAMQFGVQCWPTTVSINRDGIIDRVQFGLTHDDAYAEKTADA